MRARAFKCILLLAVLVQNATSAFSQAPQGFSYQAVIRNTTGQVLSNQDILVRISITDEAKTNTYYTEVDTVTTSAYGSINLIVGAGYSTDNFGTIPWSNGNIWVNVEVDRTRTSGFTPLGSTQLYSVPYALYSLNGSPGPEGPKGDTGNGISSISSNGNGTYTFYYTNGSTYTTDNLTGPQGPQGIPGETGPQGMQGLKGDKGDQGLPGTGLNNKGNWTSGTTYSPGDYVFAENTGQTANSMWIVKAAAAFSSTTPPRLDLGNWVEFEAPAGPPGPAGPLVTGTAGQTLRHDGITWVANSLLYNDGTNVGIGTTAPLNKLHVNGSIQIPDDYTTVGGLKIGGFGSYLARQSSDGSTVLNTAQANIIFKNINTETFRINSSGNVGIGNSNPSVRLHVTPGQIRLDGSTNPYIGVYNGTYQGYLEITSNVLGLTYNNYVRLGILSNGNVGIGTTNPYALFTVKTATDRNVGIRQNSTKTELFSGNDANNAYSILEINASTLTLNHQSGGNVGVGTTTPGYKLDVVGRSRFQTGNGSAGFWLTNNANNADRSFFGMYDDNLAGIYGIGSGWGFLMNLNNGYVGIGTAAPGVKLDVAGDIRTSTKFAAGNYGLNAGNLNAYSLELGGPNPTATSGQATLFFHHHGVSAHQLRYNNKILYLEAAGNGYGTTSTPSFFVGGPLYAAVNGGNVGVGTNAPTAKLSVRAATTAGDNDTLFTVKDKYGHNVFIVYPDAVQVIVPVNVKSSNQRGAFVVSGRGTSKGTEVNFVNLKKQNYFIGHNVAPNILTGTGNAIMGYEAGNSLTTGSNNIFLGFNAGKANDAGGNNAFVGNNAGTANKGGNNNVFLGNQAGLANTTGSENIFIGTNAGQKNTTGYSNVFIGPTSGNSITTGYNNTFVGDNSGSSLVGYGNICLGYNSGPPTSTSLNNRLYIDNGSGTETSSFIYGDMTLSSKKLRFNTPVGIYTTPGTNHALKVNGYVYITGANLGVNVDPTANYGLQVNGGTSTSFSIYAYKGGYTPGSWTSGSDIRLKKDIVPLSNTLEAINSIKPVYYYWRYDEFESRQLSHKKQIGLIAQDVEKVYPELVFEDEEGFKAVAYDKFAAVLLSAIQEQQVVIKNQQAELKSLKVELETINEQQKQLNDKDKEISELKSRLDAIEKLLKLNAK